MLYFNIREKSIMTIYFYTLQKLICKKIADILEENNNICCIYTDENEFYSAVANMKKYPDLLLLDYLVFDHDIFNIYRFMDDINCKIPLLFYNDPFSSSFTRIQHWNMILNLYYADTGINITEYTPTLQILSKTVDSKELGPYISLLQIPQPYPPERETSNVSSTCAISSLPNEEITPIRKHFSTSLYSVFNILYVNRKKSISIPELKSLLHERNIEITTNTVYSYISRLRTLLRTSAKTGTDIYKTKNGYCLLMDDENQVHAD
jgi:DNA-binding response OmpR family regulator